MRRALLLLLVTLVASAPVASQITVELGPVADTSIYSEVANNGNGGGNDLFVGRTSAVFGPDGSRRALVRFDLSSIPAGSTITAASLELLVTRRPFQGATEASVSLHRLLVAFGEGAATGTGTGATAIPPDATWAHRVTTSDAMTGTAWAAPGGLAGTDHVAGASASSSGDWSNGDTVTLAGSGMVADAQQWLDGAAGNHGWILIGGAGVGSVRAFWSREGSSPPALSLTYIEGSGAPSPTPTPPPTVTPTLDPTATPTSTATPTASSSPTPGPVLYEVPTLRPGGLLVVAILLGIGGVAILARRGRSA